MQIIQVRYLFSLPLIMVIQFLMHESLASTEVRSTQRFFLSTVFQRLLRLLLPCTAHTILGTKYVCRTGSSQPLMVSNEHLGEWRFLYDAVLWTVSHSYRVTVFFIIRSAEKGGANQLMHGIFWLHTRTLSSGLRK